MFYSFSSPFNWKTHEMYQVYILQAIITKRANDVISSNYQKGRFSCMCGCFMHPLVAPTLCGYMKDHIKKRPTPFYWALAIGMKERCHQKKYLIIKFNNLIHYKHIKVRHTPFY